MIAAPRITPLQPNSPNVPVLGGRNGVRFSRCTYDAPNATKRISTSTLTITRTVLARADWLMPTSRSPATSSTTIVAGRLNTPATGTPPGPTAVEPAAAVSSGGMCTPRSRM